MKIGSCKPEIEDPLGILTDRQKEILQAAVQGGYYEHPRVITHNDLASRFGVTPQTIGEHLQKIESKLINHSGLNDDGGFIEPWYDANEDVCGKS